MPIPSCCDRLTLRVVLLKVSPLVARLISVPEDLSLEELHDVLQLVFGWSGQAFYNFRIHGQEISRRRHLRTRLLRQFQLRRREKFLSQDAECGQDLHVSKQHTILLLVVKTGSHRLRR
jgi:hypothetical protein